MKHCGSVEATQAAAQLGVSRETLSRLSEFAELLIRWNRRINLVANQDESAVWERHIIDSLQLALLLRGADRVIDLGSGGGFPGLILAIAYPVHVDLVEADQRKCAFLREAVRVTGCDATVHPGRAERIQLPPARVVTSRALAPLDALIGLARPFLAPDGVCLFPKGRGVEDELTAALRKWHMRVNRLPSCTHPHGVILEISDIRPA